MKPTVILLCAYSTMSACIYNEELSEMTISNTTEEEIEINCTMPNIISSEETYEYPCIPNEAFAKVQICIKNQIPDLHLVVTGIKICNICLTGTYHPVTEHQTDYWETDTTKASLTIETKQLEVGYNEETLIPNRNSISFVPQTTKAWDTSELPDNNDQCYLLMNCKIYQSGTREKVWNAPNDTCTEVAIPLSIHLQNNIKTLIVLNMAPNCPWYEISDTHPHALFTPITFDASVENWKTKS